MIANTISATEFKAKCLALLDEVAQTGERIVVTKRGRPVADVVMHEPPHPVQRKLGFMRGRIQIVGDIMEPVLPPEAWEALQ